MPFPLILLPIVIQIIYESQKFYTKSNLTRPSSSVSGTRQRLNNTNVPAQVLLDLASTVGFNLDVF